jgi:hypothetical protein
MKHKLALISVATLGMFAAACSDSSAPSSSAGTPASLATAFSSLPLRFSLVSSSFADSGTNDTTLWRPGDRGDDRFEGPRGPGGRGPRGDERGRGFDMGRGNGGMPGEGGMMGGGPRGPFGGLGFDLGFGRGLHGARLPSNCVFDATSGRVNCPPDTEHGVTVTRSAAYADAAGTVQSAFDPATTNSINLRVDVNGTIIRRDGDTSVVQHASDRTVTGLAPGSTERTVNGTSTGQESTSGTDSTGSFIALRMVGDTITGVVIPVPPADTAADEDDDAAGDHRRGEHGPPPFPTAGTIVRSMTVTVTRGATTVTTSSRREVVTYNGDGTATVVITHDGTTKTCTLTRGQRPVCS